MNEHNWKSTIKKVIQVNFEDEFDLQNDLYKFTDYFRTLYPENNTIETSIRRNIQELAKDGFLQFLGNGKYKLISETPKFKLMIDRFIIQSHTNNLKTAEYPKNFKNLNVKVSFGQGNQAQIPWIAFLGFENKVQKGIYPVYLYYKELGLLILSLGVSETEQPDFIWSKEIFNKHQLIKYTFNVRRYGDSLIYKIYKVDFKNNIPNYLDYETKSNSENSIEQDLLEIIKIYKKELDIDFQTDIAEKEIIEEAENQEIYLTEDGGPKKYKSCIAARSVKFSTEVKKVYNNTCVVCGKERYTALNERPEVEAAHIYPRKYNGRNNLRNGLALCTFHHWAFDGGLFVIEDNYQIKVLPKILNNTNYHEISKFNGQKIRLPQDERFYPAEIYLKEHRKLHKF